MKSLVPADAVFCSNGAGGYASLAATSGIEHVIVGSKPGKFADAVFQLPHNLVVGDVIILGHGNTPPFEHEPSSTMQQVWRYTIAPRHD